MNPKTNKFEQLMIKPDIEAQVNGLLLRPNGEIVPEHWTQFQLGEHVVIKDYTFKVAYIGETAILFEPVGILDLGAALKGANG